MLYIILANSMADILPFMFFSVRLRPGFVHSMLFALRRRVADPKALGGARGAHRDSTVDVSVNRCVCVCLAKKGLRRK